LDVAAAEPGVAGSELDAGTLLDVGAAFDACVADEGA
jgi:hypothetical protein